MDIELAHGLWTAVLLVVFVAIVVWAWSGRRSKDFDEAARLPLEEEDTEHTEPRGARRG